MPECWGAITLEDEENQHQGQLALHALENIFLLAPEAYCFGRQFPHL